MPTHVPSDAILTELRWRVDGNGALADPRKLPSAASSTIWSWLLSDTQNSAPWPAAVAAYGP